MQAQKLRVKIINEVSDMFYDAYNYVVENFARGIAASNTELIRKSIINDECDYIQNILKQRAGITHVFGVVHRYWKDTRCETVMSWKGPLMVPLWFRGINGPEDIAKVYMPLMDKSDYWAYIIIRPKHDNVCKWRELPSIIEKVGIPVVLVGRKSPLISVVATTAYLDAYYEGSKLYPLNDMIYKWGIVGKEESNMRWLPFHRQHE